MLLLFACLLLLFTPACLPYSCEGTCQSVEQMSSSYDATCNRSDDCLVLSCGTPRRVLAYNAIAEPRFRIYPCQDPVIVNFQFNAGFGKQTFQENRNVTGDTTFPETLYFFGRAFTLYIHVRLQQLSGDRIRLGLTASLSSHTYTMFPDTVIPIDKSGCQGYEGSPQNPLCNVTTMTSSQQVNVTTSQSVDVMTNVTSSQQQIMTTSVQNLTMTTTQNQPITTQTPSVIHKQTTQTPPISTETITTTLDTKSHTQSENATISLQSNTQSNPAMIGGIVGGVMLLIAVLVAALLAFLIIAFVSKRKHMNIGSYYYKGFSSSTEELNLN